MLAAALLTALSTTHGFTVLSRPHPSLTSAANTRLNEQPQNPPLQQTMTKTTALSDASSSYRLHNDKRQIVRPPSIIDHCNHATNENNNDDPSSTLFLFSNDRIRVSDFRLHPSQTAKCKHEYPTVRWQVAYHGTAEYELKIISNDDHHHDQDADEDVKDEASQPIPTRVATAVAAGEVADRQVHYVEAGTTWEITNTSSEDDTSLYYRQIVFEFLSNKPKYTEYEIREELFANAIYSTDVGTNLVFENELCRCWDFYLDPSQGGGVDTVHHHCLDYVFINVAPSRLLGLHPETLSLDDELLLFDSVSEDNQVTWNSIPRDAGADIAFAHGGKNGYDDRPMREYLIELK
mmetsp:Transcript_839/g.1796  ORF Transcript_839/g.1796 Transcript_839/m.1796 type:complete len:349 (+) Transcript_839:56-1102(+)